MAETPPVACNCCGVCAVRFDVVDLVAVVVVAAGLGGGCSDWPAEGRFGVATTVVGEGGDVVVDFNEAARGEWWTCDLHLTSDACIDGFHVAAFLGLPVYDDVDELGSARCVDEIGPSGGLEIIAAADGTLVIPTDVSAFVLVASDVDGDGLLDLDREDEVHGRAQIVAGVVDVFGFGTFEQPLSLRITGTTAAGDDVVIDFSGPMKALGDPPPLAAKNTCD